MQTIVGLRKNRTWNSSGGEDTKNMVGLQKETMVRALCKESHKGQRKKCKNGGVGWKILTRLREFLSGQKKIMIIGLQGRELMGAPRVRRCGSV